MVQILSWLICLRGMSSIETLKFHLMILLNWQMQRKPFRKRCSYLYICQTILKEYEDHGKVFFFSVLLVRVKLCLPKQLPPKARQLSSTSLHLQSAQSGKVNPKNLFVFFLRWLAFMRPPPFSWMKSMLLQGHAPQASMNQTEGLRQNYWYKWMVWLWQAPHLPMRTKPRERGSRMSSYLQRPIVLKTSMKLLEEDLRSVFTFLCQVREAAVNSSTLTLKV